jgi:hypothetical protein
MSIQLQIEETPDYLTARFIGAGTVEEVWRQFELIAVRCKRANKLKLLLSVVEAHGEISFIDRYAFGDTSQIFVYYKLIKVAVVGRPDQLDQNRFGEKVMRNRWVNARVFTNFKDAEEWLLK